MSEARTDWFSFLPPVAKKWVKYLGGFTVGVGVGLAPFLGAAAVPGFRPLLSLYPIYVRETLIPLSILLMGMIGVIVQLASFGKPSKKKLKRWFIGSVVVFVVSFLVLLGLYSLFVVRIDGKQDSELVPFTVITGTPTVPPRPPMSRCTCVVGEPAELCIADISLNPLNVRSCFGVQRVIVATLALSLLYLILTSSLAAAVGLLVLTDLRHARSRRK
jgi:hypothetical protein